jgi:uncharacterized membrane protein (UPF0127 family)
MKRKTPKIKKAHRHRALAAAFGLAAFGLTALSASASGELLLKVLDASTGQTKAAFTVELARSISEQMRGLQGRDGIEPDRGMLFTYPSERPLSFWMKEVSFPLDILFADSQGRIKEVLENLPPCVGPVLRCPSYRSSSPASYALEIAGGRAQALGIKVGDRIEPTP